MRFRTEYNGSESDWLRARAAGALHALICDAIAELSFVRGMKRASACNGCLHASVDAEQTVLSERQRQLAAVMNLVLEDVPDDPAAGEGREGATLFFF